MAKITNIWARQILDSRGIPTIEAACQLDTGHIAVSSVPAGTSTGTHEALDLRDADPTIYQGLSVYQAVDNINQTIAKALIGKDPTNQSDIDKTLISLDGTENKSKLGANAILAISESVCKSGALASNMSLYFWVYQLAKAYGLNFNFKMPSPLFNMINGGLHGAGNLDFQEFHVIPVSTTKYSEGLRKGVEIYQTVGLQLERKGAVHSVGDEGGYAPNLFTNADALHLLVDAIREAGYDLGRDVLLGIDVAASVFFKNGEYTIRDKTSSMDDTLLIDYYKNLNDQYHLALLEDPLQEDAWESWQKIMKILGDQLMIVGDDLLVTNPKRVQKAIKEKACNSILIKPNQIGTISETLNVIKLSRDANWKVIVSHRSGETNDWFISDFAVGVGADFVKFGAPARGERVAKYNRLLSIEVELGL